MGTALALCITWEILWIDITDQEAFLEVLNECHSQAQEADLPVGKTDVKPPVDAEEDVPSLQTCGEYFPCHG